MIPFAIPFAASSASPFLRAAVAASIASLTVLSASAQEKKLLTVDAIYAHGTIGGQPPAGLTWSPDGAHLTYLEKGELMELDLETAQPKLLVSRAKLATLKGDATTEKDSDHRARYSMASYLWAPDSQHILFDANGRLWLLDLKTGAGLNLGSSGAASGDDPKFSPDGKLLSFLNERGAEHGLSVIHLEDRGTPATSVATTNNADILNGKVDWVYEEELEVRSNYFWSPDSRHLVYLQMDETRVPTYPITDFIPTHPTIDEQRYPQPGDPNPAVRVGVASVQGGPTTWIKLPNFKPGDDYIPRIGWVDPRTVWIEALTRDQKHKNLYFANAETGESKLILDQTDPKYFDDKYDIALQDGHIVFTSWADGHTHVYLYSYDTSSPLNSKAKLVRQLTKGDFDVSAIHGIDEKRKLVFYTSNEGNPTEQQIWQVDFEGQRKAVTTEAGRHTASFAPQGGYYTDRFSTRMTPSTESLCRVDGSCHQFWSTKAYDTYKLHAPEQFETKAKDGSTLYATILLPEGKHDAASVPVILNPYGGPGAQGVVNGWGGDGYLFDQLLTDHGYAVLHTDNRGSNGRGRDFAQSCYHNFGPVQFEDQLAVADAALAKYPELDPKRQGWWGWSWGGTFTLYAMTHSTRFRAGVSVAPVTDWHNYDSIYTERYMSVPKAFPDGYKDMSVVNFANNLHGHLLIVHGTGDDNVHMQNTIQFIQQLIVNNKSYDLQLYPRKTHSIAGPEVRPHLFNRILQQFDTYLAPPVTAGEK